MNVFNENAMRFGASLFLVVVVTAAKRLMTNRMQEIIYEKQCLSANLIR